MFQCQAYLICKLQSKIKKIIVAQNNFLKNNLNSDIFQWQAYITFLINPNNNTDGIQEIFKEFMTCFTKK